MRRVIAVQLWTLRAQLAEDVEGTLARLAATGVEAVELAGLWGKTEPEFRRALDDVGLRAVSAHVRLGEEIDAEALGVQHVVVPWVETPASDAEADALVERIVASGRAYHNHDFEFAPVDLWGRIVASGIELEPDVGWLRVAGLDPVTVLRELHGRCPLIHAKDVRRDGDGWLDVPAGDGELDWTAIKAAAPEATLIIELDNPSEDPFADIARSLETLS